MQYQVKFKSLHYKSFDWSALLKTCYERNDANGFPTVVSNYTRLLIPKSFLILDKVKVLTPIAGGFINTKDLEFVEHAFLNQCGIKVAKLSSIISKELKDYEGNEYLQVCAEVCKKSLNHVRNILHYTHDHLEEREAEGIKLAQHQAIKFSFATIVCHLDSAEQLLITANDISSVNVAFGYLLEALHILAELSGGRAMLRGNAVEMMFHLKLFQSVFTSIRN